VIRAGCGQWRLQPHLMEAMERNKIVEILQETAATSLPPQTPGIGRQTLYNKIKSYKIAA